MISYFQSEQSNLQDRIRKRIIEEIAGDCDALKRMSPKIQEIVKQETGKCLGLDTITAKSTR